MEYSIAFMRNNDILRIQYTNSFKYHIAHNSFFILYNLNLEKVANDCFDYTKNWEKEDKYVYFMCVPKGSPKEFFTKEKILNNYMFRKSITSDLHEIKCCLEFLKIYEIYFLLYCFEKKSEKCIL